MSAGILADPLMQMFLAQVGGETLARFMPGGQSPYEKAVGQQVQYGQRIMPELYSQAMGKPSAATQQAYRNLSAEANRLQQSYAGSMQRANPTMREPVTPVREQQARFGEAKLKGYADILSQGQTNAQNALLDMYGQGLRGQQGIEMLQREDRRSANAFLSGLVSEYKVYKQGLAGNQGAEDMYGGLLRRLVALLGGGGTGGQPIMPTQTSQTGFVLPDPNIL